MFDYVSIKNVLNSWANIMINFNTFYFSNVTLVIADFINEVYLSTSECKNIENTKFLKIETHYKNWKYMNSYTLNKTPVPQIKYRSSTTDVYNNFIEKQQQKHLTSTFYQYHSYTSTTYI